MLRSKLNHCGNTWMKWMTKLDRHSSWMPASLLGHPCTYQKTERSARQLLLQSSPTFGANFHTSSPRKAHPLIVLFVIKPLTRVAAAAAGWAAKRWWRKLTDEDKQKLKGHFLRNKIRYGGLTLFLLGTGYALYKNNVTTNPYTGRRRFMIYNPTQLAAFSKQKFTQLIALAYEEDTLLPPSHPVTEFILDVTNRLLNANIDIREVYDRDWVLYVIDDEDDFTVASFESGEIVFNTGFLSLVHNEDQLAHVLAHEMSHVILEHHAETASHEYLLSGLMMLPLALIWVIIPSEIVAAISSWIFGKTAEVTVSLPHSREQEHEADAFALKMMAKACFDVREASVMWGNFVTLQENHLIETPNTWLSTHPPESQRCINLDGKMMDAIMMRRSYKCNELPPEDPRLSRWQSEKVQAIGKLQQKSDRVGDEDKGQEEVQQKGNEDTSGTVTSFMTPVTHKSVAREEVSQNTTSKETDGGKETGKDKKDR